MVPVSADYTNSIPQSIIVTTPSDVVAQPQLPSLFLASRSESPKYFCTLQFSVDRLALGSPPPQDHIDDLQSFLAAYTNNWVSFNSLTAAIALSIALTFPRNMAVTAIESIMDRCRICASTSDSNVTVFCSTVKDFTTLILSTDVSQQSHRPSKESFNIHQSATLRHNVHITGMDFTFPEPFSLTMTEATSVMLHNVCQLVTTACILKYLQCMLLVFPWCTSSKTDLSGVLEFFISYFLDWRVSVVCISCTTLGDPVAAYRLLVWGVHKSTMFSFDPLLERITGDCHP